MSYVWLTLTGQWLFNKKVMRFDRNKIPNPPKFDHVTDTGEQRDAIIGYTFVPSYMVDLRKRMIPISTQDGASKKKPANGTMYTEVTKDELDRVHAVGIQDFVGTENREGYDYFNDNLLEVYGPGNLDPPNNGVIGDRAHALRHSLTRINGRQAKYLACCRHLALDMTRFTKSVFETIRKIPPARRGEVCHSMCRTPCHDAITASNNSCCYVGGRWTLF